MSAVLASGLLGGACGDPDVAGSTPTTATARRDGEPDCNDGRPWNGGGSVDLDTLGEPTAEAALRPHLERWRELFGGEITMVAQDRAALIVDGVEVVVASTTRTKLGGFAVTDVAGCDGYEPELLPGPPSPDQPT
ncbi:MAG: hypothetical protein ACRDZ2_13750, partial [Ilumatobacteraceae bacterium]